MEQLEMCNEPDATIKKGFLRFSLHMEETKHTKKNRKFNFFYFIFLLILVHFSTYWVEDRKCKWKETIYCIILNSMKNVWLYFMQEWSKSRVPTSIHTTLFSVALIISTFENSSVLPILLWIWFIFFPFFLFFLN